MFQRFNAHLYDRMMVPEAPLEQKGAGLVPAGAGWFVLNARDARRRSRLANDVARRYGASPDETTQDSEAANATFPESHPARYRDGWLP